MPLPRPVIVVTGSNSGVGFGICHRILIQLCDPTPTDVTPPWATLKNANFDGPEAFPLPCTELTLIMACRSVPRAEVARKKLLSLLDAYVRSKKVQRGPNREHAERFKDNVEIEIRPVNLAMLSSVQAFTNDLAKDYTYISHLICNAGVASFTHLDWPVLIKQLLISPLGMMTEPVFYVEEPGEKSLDGLGWVWQCNFFGHYYMYRNLLPLLSSSSYPRHSRVIWTSSMEARPSFYTADDWQLLKTDHPYAASKYQTDLVASYLDSVSRQQDDGHNKVVRHFVAHPGVCSSNIAATLTGAFLEPFKTLLFYFGRIFLGSPNHPILPFKSAISATFLALVSLTFVTFTSSKGTPKANGTASSANGAANGSAKSSTNGSALVSPSVPLKYGSQTDRWGRERVNPMEVRGWREHEKEAEVLVGRCEELYLSLRQSEDVKVMNGESVLAQESESE